MPRAGSIAVAIRTSAVLYCCLTTAAANNLRSTSHRRSKNKEENVAQNTLRSLQEEPTFRCPEHHAGYYPTSDCKSYYWCSGDGGKDDSLLYSCDDGLLFDVQKERCDWEMYVDCNDAPYPNNVMLELANGITVSAQLGEPIYFPNYWSLTCIGEKEGDEKLKPSWMTSQHMFKSKERCCTEQFWWADSKKCLGDGFVEMNYLSVSATERPTASPTSDSVQGLDLDVIQVSAQLSTSEQVDEPETPCEIINCERLCDKTPHFSTETLYDAYDQVIADDALYECKEPPVDLYCSSGGYEPGSGLYWDLAWTLRIESLECPPPPVPTSSLTNEPTIEPTGRPTNEPTSETEVCAPRYSATKEYVLYDTVSHDDHNYKCQNVELCNDGLGLNAAAWWESHIPCEMPPTMAPTKSMYPTSSPTLAGIQCAPPYTVGHPYKFMEEMSFNSWNYACFLPDLCQDAQYAPRLSDDDVGKAWWKTDECVGMQTRHPTPQPTVGPTTSDLNSLVLVPTTEILRWHVDYISRTCVVIDRAVWLEYWSWIEEDELYYSKEQCCKNHYGSEPGYSTCISNGDDGSNK